jgi:hypothetical protein
VAELVFKLYGRALHPELFEIYASQTIKRGNYEAKIDITSAGHVVTWFGEGSILSEVAASAHHPLPKTRLLVSHALKGDRSERVECRGGVKYEMRFQMEPTEPEIFMMFQKELAETNPGAGMLHRFESSGRMALGAISYINWEVRNKKLMVQAFHTFPDDCAIVKTRSTFQLP